MFVYELSHTALHFIAVGLIHSASVEMAVNEKHTRPTSQEKYLVNWFFMAGPANLYDHEDSSLQSSAKQEKPIHQHPALQTSGDSCYHLSLRF